MVLPVAPQVTISQPTQEMQEPLRKLRYCVIGLWVAFVGQLCTDNVMSLSNFPLMNLTTALCGVFVLREDDTLLPCYRCLMSSPIGSCAGPSGGGLACVMPFLVASSLSCMLNVLFNMVFASMSGACGPSLIIVCVFQFLSAYFASKLHTLISAASLTAGEDGQPLTQPLSMLRGMQGPAGGMTPPQGGSAAHGHGPEQGSARNFHAFQGSGQRLGD
mmetsp:Transcript_17734/g.41125  ORF Transcript_17734/g.41125 Transcript_17734/m.41125 type:complete len:217 (-) Transcript_17734:8-658(-)